MTPRIVLVGCGKAKASSLLPARDLYVGGLFRAARAHAEALVAIGAADGWLILSGKHGVLDPTEEIAPYDEKAPGVAERMADWGARAVEQLRSRFPGELTLDVFAGVLYTVPISHLSAGLRLPWKITEPLSGLEIGERLRWFRLQRLARAA